MLLYTILNITMVPKRQKNVLWQCLNTFTFLLKRSFLVKHFSCRLLLDLCFFFCLGLKIHLSCLTRLLKKCPVTRNVISDIFSSKGQYWVDLSHLLVGLAHISSSLLLAFHLGLFFSRFSLLQRGWLTRPEHKESIETSWNANFEHCD